MKGERGEKGEAGSIGPMGPPGPKGDRGYAHPQSNLQVSLRAGNLEIHWWCKKESHMTVLFSCDY